MEFAKGWLPEASKHRNPNLRLAKIKASIMAIEP